MRNLDTDPRPAASNGLDRLRQRALDASREAIIMFDDADCCVEVNEAFLGMVGTARAVILGLPRLILEAQICGRDATTESAAGLPQPGQDPLEMTLLGPLPLHVSCEARELHDDSGRMMGTAFYFRHAAQDQSARQRSEFYRNAAHELKNSLAGVHGFAELLIAWDHPEETRRDLLQTIHRMSDDVVRTITDVHDLSRLDDRGSDDFQMQAADAVTLISDLVGDRGKPLLARWQGAGAPVWVSCDPDQFAKALRKTIGSVRPAAEPATIRLVTSSARPNQVGVRVDGSAWSDTASVTVGGDVAIALVRATMANLGGALEIAPARRAAVTLWLRTCEPPQSTLFLTKK